jgi:uncharacterized UBP type Zn finger protein
MALMDLDREVEQEELPAVQEPVVEQETVKQADSGVASEASPRSAVCLQFTRQVEDKKLARLEREIRRSVEQICERHGLDIDPLLVICRDGKQPMRPLLGTTL